MYPWKTVLGKASCRTWQRLLGIHQGDYAVDKVVHLLFPLGDSNESPEVLYFKHLDLSLRFHEQSPCLAAMQHFGDNERRVKSEFDSEADTSAVPNPVEPGHHCCCCHDSETNIHHAAIVFWGGHVQMFEGLPLLQPYSVHSDLHFTSSNSVHHEFAFVHVDFHLVFAMTLLLSVLFPSQYALMLAKELVDGVCNLLLLPIIRWCRQQKVGYWVGSLQWMWRHDGHEMDLLRVDGK